MFKINEELKVINLFASTTVSADVATTTGVSVEGYEDDALVILQVGRIQSTSATFAINVTASTVVSGIYSDIGTFTTFDSSGQGLIATVPVSLAGNNKFLKLDVDVSGYLPNAVISAVAVVRPTVAQSGLNSATLA